MATPPGLTGRVALITGARVSIGYATALHFLRAGATVLALTRFPQDAARRYAAEPDFDVWRDRLRIHSLDLRQVPAVEHFADHLNATGDRLDILINNAAQTIRRPPAYYAHLAAFEAMSHAALPDAMQALLGDMASAALSTPVSANPLLPVPEEDETESQWFPSGKLTPDGQQVDLRPRNSWTFNDEEVSALELVEVHVVNAIAPFLLCSRLKPLLARTAARDDTGTAFVINVTSLEGAFRGKDKSARHPHTNMAKAALNMMTRTCADDYRRYRIYMNAVDPGWVSFQHPHAAQARMRADGLTPPFDMLDAAVRLCDPVFNVLAGQKPIAGRLFKDFREVEW
jgi:NAD(P)-dependent dehydrogenase (short-subunit alcohol dehydrogenase family)